MAFRDFTFPEVLTTFGLSHRSAPLFRDVPEWQLESAFTRRLRAGSHIATGNGNDKGKSEFQIAQVLLELSLTFDERISIFTGQEWNPDPARGLNGSCDFLVTPGTRLMSPAPPFLVVAEAEADNPRSGYGQCIAGLVAALEANGVDGPIPHGVVTTGDVWQFLRIDGSVVTFDIDDYSIDAAPKILGILRRVILTAAPELATAGAA